MEVDNHYLYPSQDAEFGRYNFHRPAIIDKLAALLVSPEPQSPRIIELAGTPRSGRHYLLRAAAFQATRQGSPAAVTSLDLTGYEPDRQLKQFVAHLAKTAPLTQADRIRELANRGKAELKVTPWSFLCASLAIKWDPSLEELSRLLQSPPLPIGPDMSHREQLRRLLGRETQRHRLIIHIREGQTLDVTLRARLTDEPVLNSKLYVAFSHPENDVRLSQSL